MFLFGPPNVEKMKARRDVKGLIKALAYQKDSDVRRAAAHALGALGDPRAVEPLIAALKDKESWVREAAAEALVQIGAPAVEPLIAALKDKESWVREAAAEALGRIGDPRAVEPLIADLSSKSYTVRLKAAKALGKIGDARAVDPLISILDDERPEVARAAANALKRIGDPRGIERVNAWDALRINKMREKKEAKRLKKLVDDFIQSLRSIVIDDWMEAGDLVREGDKIIPFVLHKLRSIAKTGDNMGGASFLLDILGRINTPAAFDAVWEFVSMPPTSNRVYRSVVRRAAIKSIIVHMRDLEIARKYIPEIISTYLAMVPDNEDLSELIRDVIGDVPIARDATRQQTLSISPKEEAVAGDSDQRRPLYLPTKLYRSMRFGSNGVGCGHSYAYSYIIFKTLDGGQTWQEVETHEGGYVSAVYFLDLDTGWACIRDNSGNTFVIKTSDGGATWTKSKPLTDHQLESIFFADKNHGWAVGWGGKIFATTNGGTSWVAQRSGVKTPLWGVHFVDTQTGCAVGEEGVILRTTDGGRTWSFVESGTIAWLRAVFFTDCLYGWAVGKVILATKDGGVSWSKQYSGRGESMSSVYFADRRSGWVAGDGLLMMTEDGGVTWQERAESE